jgi:nucleoside-diphosphate-sugar epimerase
MLVQAGHEVVGMTRTSERKRLIEQSGARAVVVDVFDREAMIAAVGDARPDAVIHQLTALSDWNLADNARIRTEGTRNLVDAALAAGVRSMISQSICWAYEPGDGPAAEQTPLDLGAPMPRQMTIDGVAALETATAELPHHVILRYGMLYGPGTWYERGGFMAAKVMNGELPATDGVVSFLHVEDAARAAVLALGWPSGPVNVADDEPAAGTQWLPVYAAALGAPTPEHRPGSNRGERGASNAKARSEYGWEPLYPTWRSGFAQASS